MRIFFLNYARAVLVSWRYIVRTELVLTCDEIPLRSHRLGSRGKLRIASFKAHSSIRLRLLEKHAKDAASSFGTEDVRGLPGVIGELPDDGMMLVAGIMVLHS